MKYNELINKLELGCLDEIKIRPPGEVKII